MALTPTAKIAIGWTLVIAAGLGSFVLARDAVVGNRRTLMATRQRIKDQAQRESTEAFEQKQAELNSEKAV